MRKTKAVKCTKEEAKKDVRERMWEDVFTILFHIWEGNQVGIELDNTWDLDKAWDYFIEWFRYGCISSLLEIWEELMWDDVSTNTQIIKDFLDQLHYQAKRKFWMDEKEESINKFAELFRKSVKRDKEEDED